MSNEALLWLLNGIFAILFAGAGWFARQMWDAVNTLKRDLSSLEVKIAREYVPYDRLKDAFEPIMATLLEIKETLKQKADK